ncbi:hypothetical protein [Ferrimonas balearica]|uniref:hypothetical protein n=1 Tax=Ferrimonas balearica TaxID=44012 RepID=UPI001C99EC83|nr:hypothetical protein [Ferrimonas balearica]MBY5992332.1 hypothetical protein [Ferrimonas balearica]
MSATTMVVVIVAIVMGCVMEMSRHHSKGMGRKQKQQMDDAMAELKQQNELLAKRVATLEAIVTDRGFDLDQEIRKLG